MNGPRPYMPDPLKIAEAIQADLKAIGVTAEIKTFEWGTYLDGLAAKYSRGEISCEKQLAEKALKGLSARHSEQ